MWLDDAELHLVTHPSARSSQCTVTLAALLPALSL